MRIMVVSVIAFLTSFLVVCAGVFLIDEEDTFSLPASHSANIPGMVATEEESERIYLMAAKEEEVDPELTPLPTPEPEPLPEPEPEPEPVYVPTKNWYVTTNEYTDRVGNLCTIYNFMTTEWAEARQWCIDNYNPDWPYGEVKAGHKALNWGVANAIATAACCVRECSTTPDILQYMGYKTPYSGVLGQSYSTQEIYDILYNPAQAQGYGLIGFTFSNLTHLVQFCEASNLDPRHMESQLLFMAYQYYAYKPIYKQYAYLVPHNDYEVTLQNVSYLARLHTSVIGMCNKPTAYYAKPTAAVQNILKDWGNMRYPDFVRAASGAFDLLNTYAQTGIVPR